MEKIHYSEGDTDSMFLWVAGNPKDGYLQEFKNVILDEKFYNENVYKWLPSTFYSTYGSNQKFQSKIEQKMFDKKFGGFAFEKSSECLIALAPKVYYYFNLDEVEKINEKQYKVKGVCKRQNPLTPKNNCDVLTKRDIRLGKNINLQLSRVEFSARMMSKILIENVVLSPIHTKYQVVNDFSSTIPLGMKYKDSNLKTTRELLLEYAKDLKK
jgi:hypothetical protein